MSLSGVWTKSIPLFASILITLVGSPCGGQEDTARVVGVQSFVIGEEPLRVFKNVEAAWRSGNSQALASLLTDSRVFVEIRGIEDRGGYFTRSQLFYILKDMFGSTKQLNFTFVRYYSLEKQGGRAYAIAQRSYKNNRSNKLYQDKVYFTLVKEESRWAVAEIKSTW